MKSWMCWTILRSFLLVLVVGVGCQVSPGARPTRALQSGAPLRHLDGDVSLNPEQGVIELRLAPASCLQPNKALDQYGDLTTVEAPCANTSWESARVIAPWGEAFGPPVFEEPDRLLFYVEWRATGVDPLEDDDPAVLNQPWRFTAASASDLTWTPGAGERHAMLAIIGNATDTQIGVADVSAPPKVVLDDVRFESELRNGTRNQLVVTVSNHGSGSAYRLAAITRSNIPALHGLRLAFGQLEPGQSKTRQAKMSLPRVTDEAQALVVLVFEEAHRYAPAQTSMRFAVRPAVDQAVLVMTCSFDDLGGDKPRVDAGTAIHVTCAVRNEGAATRGARLYAKVGEDPSVIASEPFDLGADRSFSATLPLEVPRDAKLDSLLSVTLWVRDEASGGQTEASLTLEVARPQICPGGKISRATYKTKLAELRRKLDAGLISKEDFERYEAELVGCME